jgi:hypothetical protein
VAGGDDVARPRRLCPWAERSKCRTEARRQGTDPGRRRNRSRPADTMDSAPSSVSAPAQAAGAPDSHDRDQMLRAVQRQLLKRDPEFRHLRHNTSLAKPNALVDYVLAADGDSHQPDDVFTRLRWGGQFVYLSRRRQDIEPLPELFSRRGYFIETPPTSLRTGLGLPLFSRKAHYFIARKNWLVRPREITERFTYHVELEPQELPDGRNWVVRKEIPTFERVVARLRARGTDLPLGVIERRAKKFVEQIFPLFLTREAAMLKIIERECPPEYKNRFPHVVHLEKDNRGYVKRLWTNWLRNGGQPLTQLEFARQSAQLLHVLHDRIRIMHLDLRLDNFVITENGVGFVDFGSAVRIGENIQGNAVLSTLFGELMRTSQIQRMLDKMRTAGTVTSCIINDAYQQVDKAVDLFYLAVQIAAPLSNPDFRGLVQHDPHSREAQAINQLTNEILRPPNPDRPKYRSSKDVLDAILAIEAELKPGAHAHRQHPDIHADHPVPIA